MFISCFSPTTLENVQSPPKEKMQRVWSPRTMDVLDEERKADVGGVLVVFSFSKIEVCATAVATACLCHLQDVTPIDGV